MNYYIDTNIISDIRKKHEGGKFGPRERVEGYHPFPALSAIRIPARSPEPSTTLLRKADAVFLKKIRNTGLYGAI